MSSKILLRGLGYVVVYDNEDTQAMFDWCTIQNIKNKLQNDPFVEYDSEDISKTVLDYFESDKSYNVERIRKTFYNSYYYFRFTKIPLYNDLLEIVKLNEVIEAVKIEKKVKAFFCNNAKRHHSWKIPKKDVTLEILNKASEFISSWKITKTQVEIKTTEKEYEFIVTLL